MVRFWCSTLETPWSWRFQAYPGIWAAVLVIFVPYLMAQKRRGPSPTRRREMWFFSAGVLAFWLATDWPLGLLGASYLAFAHMLQFVLYSMVAAPLLMLGTPEWLARRRLGRLRLYRLSCRLARPVTAGLAFNAILIATHNPFVLDNLRSNQFGSFVMDAFWLLGGLIVWLPIISPLPEQRMTSYPGRMTYLFLALGVVPAVPAGFLTFASFPLYSTYELAPRVHGLAAGTDQRLAGLVMKLGGIPVVWGTIVVLMTRWAAAEGYGQPKRPKGPETLTA